MFETNWYIEEEEDNIRFISPIGFKFEYASLKEIMAVLGQLPARDTYISTRHSEHIWVDHFGNLVVVRADKWINPTTKMDDTIGNVIDFSKVILTYIGKLLNADTH